jgi:hypothetical protein
MDSAAAVAWPCEGGIASRAEFQAAVRGVLTHVAERGVRRMVWVSPDFEAWPVDEPPLLDALSVWARHRTVHMVWMASDFDALRRRAPRLVTWRQHWSHALQCLAPADEVVELPSLLLVDDQLVVKLFDKAHWRGRISCSAPDIQAAREQFDALLQRSTETFPVTTLGI